MKYYWRFTLHEWTDDVDVSPWKRKQLANKLFHLDALVNLFDINSYTL